ncbi:MAG: hypothetical protein HUU55_05885 [Myxococcales bacterium]|nr:hypothetical protein [Myxococcales bacterium]
MSQLPMDMKSICLTVLFLTTISCEQDDSTSHAHNDSENIAAELCEHMAEGPSIAVFASAETTNLPDVSTPHTRFDVTLVADESGTWSGSVRYASPGTGDLRLATSKTIDVTLTAPDGSTVVAMPDAMASTCADIPKLISFPVSVGPYTLSFGPSDTADVKIVIELDDGNESN